MYVSNPYRIVKPQKLNRMKIVDKIIGKIGVDKVLHFLVGALATALASMEGESHMYATALVVLAL